MVSLVAKIYLARCGGGGLSGGRSITMADRVSIPRRKLGTQGLEVQHFSTYLLESSKFCSWVLSMVHRWRGDDWSRFDLVFHFILSEIIYLSVASKMQSIIVTGRLSI